MRKLIFAFCAVSLALAFRACKTAPEDVLVGIDAETRMNEAFERLKAEQESGGWW